jgi:hypothetical protein
VKISVQWKARAGRAKDSKMSPKTNATMTMDNNAAHCLSSLTRINNALLGRSVGALSRHLYTYVGAGRLCQKVQLEGEDELFKIMIS